MLKQEDLGILLKVLKLWSKSDQMMKGTPQHISLIWQFLSKLLSCTFSNCTFSGCYLLKVTPEILNVFRITFRHGQHLETSPQKRFWIHSDRRGTVKSPYKLYKGKQRGQVSVDGCKNKLSAGTLDGRRLLWRERWNFLSSHFGKSPGSVHLRHGYTKYANAFQILISCYRRLFIGDIFLESLA